MKLSQRPAGEDYFLAQVPFGLPQDGFWTCSKVYCGSWWSLAKTLRFALSRHQPSAPIQLYQGATARAVLIELRRQTRLHRELKAGQVNN